MSRHDDLLRLRHMRDHAAEAVAFAAGRAESDLEGDRLLQLGMSRLVEIIGEAASRVSDQGRELVPELPWPDVVGMRHRIVHGYDRLDVQILWRTVVDDLPPLIAIVSEAIERIERRL